MSLRILFWILVPYLWVSILVVVYQDNKSSTHTLDLPTVDDNWAGLGYVASRKFRATRNATKG